MNGMYVRKMIELVSLLLIVIGALNWGLVGAFGFNVVAWLASKTFSALATIVYILVGVAALVHLFSRNYYLPFLGDCAFPCGSLVEKVPKDATIEARVNVGAAGVNVIYWAAEPGKEVAPSPWVAYDKYANSGVAVSDANGDVVMRVRAPVSYKVPSGRTLGSHVHYRVCNAGGMLSPVKTVFV
jgi:uncharacterized membrane protein YuzA (DUF378 family)